MSWTLVQSRISQCSQPNLTRVRKHKHNNLNLLKGPPTQNTATTNGPHTGTCNPFLTCMQANTQTCRQAAALVRSGSFVLVAQNVLGGPSWKPMQRWESTGLPSIAEALLVLILVTSGQQNNFPAMNAPSFLRLNFCTSSAAQLAWLPAHLNCSLVPLF